MSEFLEISGGIPLKGTVRVSGAKNAALPVLIASLLTSDECIIDNVPNLEDVSITLHLLEQLGARTSYLHGRATVEIPRLVACETSYSLVKALRASFWVLGPLLARGGAARVALPGGDMIGARPVDMHLSALGELGADIKVKHGIVYATAPNGLKGTKISLRFPSVGATHQIMMAAALAGGETVIENAAREPEIVCVADFINSMGGQISGAGSTLVRIQGKSSLGAGKISLIGDRIEAATYLLAAAASKGAVKVEGICADLLGKFMDLLKQMGAEVDSGSDCISVRTSGPLKPVNVATGPFPEFATDIQAPLMAALCFADGVSTIEENIFEGRFGHVSELCRMGADIQISDRVATIRGIARLSGAPVEVHDIRAGAALVIAALCAEGISELHEAHHLRRGYESLEHKLSFLGGRLGRKVKDPEDFMFSGC